MNFRTFLESFVTVYHASPVPVDSWTKHDKQVSGYYPGLYTFLDLDYVAEFGKYFYKIEIDPSEFYEIKDADDLKKQAKSAGFFTTNGSGYWECQYLKSQGYQGIKRGREFILFYPEKHRIDNI